MDDRTFSRKSVHLISSFHRKLSSFLPFLWIMILSNTEVIIVKKKKKSNKILSLVRLLFVDELRNIMFIFSKHRTYNNSINPNQNVNRKICYF